MIFPTKKLRMRATPTGLKILIRVAPLSDAHREAVRASMIFEANWNIVKDWSEQSRYKKHSRYDAESIFTAIADKKHGVLKWIKQHW